MSFGAFISGGALTRNLEAEFQAFHQAEIANAAIVGYEYLTNEIDDATHTPIETHNLIGTVQIPIQNQYSVTFKIAGVLPDPVSGVPKPYGWAQETGWHDRGQGFHPGHHMVENAAIAAKEAYVTFMTNPGRVQASTNGIRSSEVGGAGWTASTDGSASAE